MIPLPVATWEDAKDLTPRVQSYEHRANFCKKCGLETKEPFTLCDKHIAEEIEFIETNEPWKDEDYKPLVMEIYK